MEILADAVQPPAWQSALPRPWFRDKTPIPTQQPWFCVYALPGGDFAIYEPHHFQEVISFLLIGSEGALLWDTGMGIGNMRALVEELTQLPLTVVNSHTHFDHVGCNHRFDAVYAFDHPAALARLENGQRADTLRREMTPESFALPPPADFDPATYAIAPCRAVPVREGHVFDLGDRRFEVFHTPGHSPESIMLLERKSGILLTGDTFYPATLYAHMSSDDGLNSSFATYAQTMRALPGRVGPIRALYCSHNEPICPPTLLDAVAEAFARVQTGDAPYMLDSAGLRKYQFEGFALVTQNPPQQGVC